MGNDSSRKDHGQAANKTNGEPSRDSGFSENSQADEETVTTNKLSDKNDLQLSERSDNEQHPDDDSQTSLSSLDSNRASIESIGSSVSTRTTRDYPYLLFAIGDWAHVNVDIVDVEHGGFHSGVRQA